LKASLTLGDHMRGLRLIYTLTVRNIVKILIQPWWRSDRLGEAHGVLVRREALLRCIWKVVLETTLKMSLIVSLSHYSSLLPSQRDILGQLTIKF
jgi:hypothetical protein